MVTDMDRLQNLDYIIGCLMKEQDAHYQIPASLEGKQRLMRALMNVRRPLPATPQLLEAQDEELRRQAADKGIVRLTDLGSEAPAAEGGGLQGGAAGLYLWLWQGDITRLEVDAIVNAANAQLLGCWAPLHACIDNCIHSAAGIQLRQECYELMQAQGHDEPTGTAKLTGGYNLPTRHVIHTVGPIIDGDWPTAEQEEQLASCYRACLDVADQHRLESIAFCCISTGVFHFPNDLAAEIAVRTVRDWAAAHAATASLRHVVFNVFLDKDLEIYRQQLNIIKK